MWGIKCEEISQKVFRIKAICILGTQIRGVRAAKAFITKYRLVNPVQDKLVDIEIGAQFNRKKTDRKTD